MGLIILTHVGTLTQYLLLPRIHVTPFRFLYAFRTWCLRERRVDYQQDTSVEHWSEQRLTRLLMVLSFLPANAEILDPP
jgi:hypothetical protein